MTLTYEDVINADLVAHTKRTLNNSESLTYYIDQSTGPSKIDQYISTSNGIIKSSTSIHIVNSGNSIIYQDFIRNSLQKLDNIIDLDFYEMSHNNGSMLDIYSVNYSSSFDKNVIGQAIPQQSELGSWWEILWKGQQQGLTKDMNSNTIIHEIGHSLGLGHPFNDASNPNLNSQDTIMSYNRGGEEWNTWFSEVDLNALISIWGRENDLGFINYKNNQSFYKFKRVDQNNYYIVTEIGDENITNITSLNFAEQSISVINEIIPVFNFIQDIDGISSKIYRLYNAALSRFPDREGLEYWINNNLSNKDTYKATATSFLISEEYKKLYGDELSNTDFINNLYKNILGRSSDDNGFNYWIGQLNTEQESRVDVLLGFSESMENKLLFMEETGIGL